MSRDARKFTLLVHYLYYHFLSQKLDRNRPFLLRLHRFPRLVCSLSHPGADTAMSLSADDGGEQRAELAHGSTVSEKYQGTRFDRQDMSVLGKKQVLRRQFKFSTMLGFASTVCYGVRTD